MTKSRPLRSVPVSEPRTRFRAAPEHDPIRVVYDGLTTAPSPRAAPRPPPPNPGARQALRASLRGDTRNGSPPAHAHGDASDDASPRGAHAGCRGGSSRHPACEGRRLAVPLPSPRRGPGASFEISMDAPGRRAPSVRRAGRGAARGDDGFASADGPAAAFEAQQRDPGSRGTAPLRQSASRRRACRARRGCRQVRERTRFRIFRAELGSNPQTEDVIGRQCV
jgi:hypothetical protein